MPSPAYAQSIAEEVDDIHCTNGYLHTYMVYLHTCTSLEPGCKFQALYFSPYVFSILLHSPIQPLISSPNS